MFEMPWTGKLTALRTSGKAGEKICEATFVAGAEDGLFLQDSIGAAGKRAYKDVKAGRLGTVDISMPHRWICCCTISYMDASGKAEQMVSNRAIPESLVIVASKDPSDPPKARMKVSFEWSDKDGELVFLARAYKKEVQVEICGLQGVIPFDQEPDVKPPKKRSKANGESAELGV